MILCLQAGAAEEAEFEEVTHPRDSVLVKLVTRRDIRDCDMSHSSPSYVASHQGWAMCIWGPVGLLDCHAMHLFS